MYIFRVKLWKYTKWKTKQRWEDDIKNGVGFNLIGSGSKSEWMSNEDFLVDILKWLRRGEGGANFYTDHILAVRSCARTSGVQCCFD